mmetsp:Transcript_15885/g.26834  ORF Transcript_15885/g.26834 Transcript_15885/m.26834 type:complete len:82 (-) Transcript_15885:256-501(-)
MPTATDSSPRTDPSQYSYFSKMANGREKTRRQSIEGSGKITYDDGDVYTGSFKDNLPHGSGKMEYVDGKVSEGIWKDGKLI